MLSHWQELYLGIRIKKVNTASTYFNAFKAFYTLGTHFKYFAIMNAEMASVRDFKNIVFV